MAREIRAAVAPSRHVHLVLENENNDAGLLRLETTSCGFDAQWADDLHHAVHVMLTGEREGILRGFRAGPGNFARPLSGRGLRFSGEPSLHQGGKPRGTPCAHLPTTAFVIALQNHDQIGNRAFGERLNHLAHPEALQAATAMLLLAPQIPLLFMGQEWGATAPFLYFSSHQGELAAAVTQGRRLEFARFAAFAEADGGARIPDPNDIGTFTTSVPDRVEIARGEHARWLDLHHRLLAIRTAEIVPRLLGTVSKGAKVIGEGAVCASWRLGDGAELLIVVNLGAEAAACPPPWGRVLFATDARIVPKILAPYSIQVTLQESEHA